MRALARRPDAVTQASDRLTIVPGDVLDRTGGAGPGGGRQEAFRAMLSEASCVRTHPVLSCVRHRRRVNGQPAREHRASPLIRGQSEPPNACHLGPLVTCDWRSWEIRTTYKRLEPDKQSNTVIGAGFPRRPGRRGVRPVPYLPGRRTTRPPDRSGQSYFSCLSRKLEKRGAERGVDNRVSGEQPMVEEPLRYPEPLTKRVSETAARFPGLLRPGRPEGLHRLPFVRRKRCGEGSACVRSSGT